MKVINKGIMEAVSKGIASGDKSGKWRCRGAKVEWDADKVSASYWGNEVFRYGKKDGDWWVSACGWNTSMSREKINASLLGAKLPYEMFRRNWEMCMRSTASGREWPECGCRRITKSDVECAGI